mgnify:CR=1 FL=1
MSEFYFVEDLTEEEFHGGEVYVKTAGNNTEFAEDKSPGTEEELRALMMYNQNPDIAEYFPEPLQAIRNKDEDLIAYTMEIVDTDTRIEYALDDNPRALVENAVSELEDVVHTIHEDPELPAHGQLVGNTYFEYGSPAIINPRGIPNSRMESIDWEEKDKWQLEWLKENALPETENIII